MNASITIAILAAAGAAAVMQNLLMVRITGSVSTVIIALVINSSVGLVLLLGALLVRNGVAGISEAVGALRPWAVLPGLLGSYFVFASITGFQRVGAAPAIAVLVASQLVAGLAADAMRADAAQFRPGLLALAGVAMLIGGAFLVVRSRI